MSPLRIFYALYVLIFATSVVVGFLAVEYVRWPMVALGVMVTIFGLCLMTNLLGFATETAANAGKNKWTPPAFASVGLVRLMGVFFLLVGGLFAAQAFLIDLPLDQS